jgi:hypothetical protein
MKYDKKEMEILTEIWDNTHEGSLICPDCGNKLILVQIEPIENIYDAYVPYDTVIECVSCSFNIRAQSYALLGSVKNFDLHFVEIGSWSQTGIRILSKYEHILDFELLKNLKESGDLVEFLVVNDHVVQIIG